jgi:phosphoglycolate phosphatase-like HAD superfamily hydrolase
VDRLILFDIDGTLTRTQDGYIPFNEAILQTFCSHGDIRTVVPDVNTDPLIVEDIFTKANVKIEIQDNHWEKFTSDLRERYHIIYRTARRRSVLCPARRSCCKPFPAAMVSVRAL